MVRAVKGRAATTDRSILGGSRQAGSRVAGSLPDRSPIPPDSCTKSWCTIAGCLMIWLSDDLAQPIILRLLGKIALILHFPHLARTKEGYVKVTNVDAMMRCRDPTTSQQPPKLLKGTNVVW